MNGSYKGPWFTGHPNESQLQAGPEWAKERLDNAKQVLDKLTSNKTSVKAYLNREKVERAKADVDRWSSLLDEHSKTDGRYFVEKTFTGHRAPMKRSGETTEDFELRMALEPYGGWVSFIYITRM